MKSKNFDDCGWNDQHMLNVGNLFPEIFLHKPNYAVSCAHAWESAVRAL